MTVPAVAFVRERLEALADPARAAQMQAYLKTTQPMLGVSRPAQKPVWRDLKRAFVPADRAEWEATVRALWAEPEREMQYAAIDYAEGFRRREFLDPTVVPLLEQMVVEGAWWDLVDEIASHLVGAVVASHREVMRPVLEGWITHEHLWLRRTAVLAQLRHKGDTDTAMLFDFCLRCAPETSFWMRKAIGWALRQHAHHDPEAVRRFLEAHGDALSGLSRREASKHLGAK
ncbi:MAG: DNA alkylation repair protein [Myxococcota bacterium]